MPPRAIAFERVIWLFPVVTTLHNLEEVIWLPAWSQHAGFLHPPVATGQFAFSVSVLTLLAWVVTFQAARRGGRWLAVAAAYWLAMLLNVALPHLLASVMEGRYTPGIATALALNLPVDYYLLRRALRDGHLTKRALIRTSLVFIPALLLAIPLLLAAGRLLFS